MKRGIFAQRLAGVPLALCVTLCSWIGLYTRVAQAQFACTAQTPQYCAGGVNPIGKPSDAITFPISQVMAFAPGPTNGDALTITSFLNTATNGDKYGPMQHYAAAKSITPFDANATYVAASGRIVPPGLSVSGNDGYPTDVVYAYRNADGLIQVDFVNPEHAKYGGVVLQPPSWDGTAFAPRLDLATYGTSSDFIAIAVGDLDGSIDANGETSDEVVVAVPVLDASNTWKMDVYVLNYGGSSGPPVISENNTIHSSCGAGCFLTQSALTTDRNQHTVLGSGNIVSLAIGDYDGDGNNELALAHIDSGDSLFLTMFRYHDYDRNPASAGLTTMFDYEQLGADVQPADPKSYVGTVSLVSGDFDDDGIDELALGYSEWWKNSNHTPGKSDELVPCIGWGKVTYNTPDLVTAICDYSGYALGYDNMVTIYHSGMTPVNGTVVGSAGADTRLKVPNAIKIVPNQVFISGATGAWAALNGSWRISNVEADTFTIPVDSSTFGAPTKAAVSVSTTTPFVKGNTDSFDPREDNPGGYGLLPNLDLRDPNSRPTIQLVSGLFNFDTVNYSFHRRQLLAVWNTPVPADHDTTVGEFSPTPFWEYDLVARYYRVASDGTYTPTPQTTTQLGGASFSANGGYGSPHQRFSLTASNLYGAAVPTDPTWSFVIGAATDQSTYRVLFGKVYDTEIHVDQTYHVDNGLPPGTDYHGSFPVVQHDPDGSSYFLGAPVHYQVSQFLTPGFILEEPPKHMAWLKDDEGTYSLVNVSRTVGTYTSVTLDSSTTSATTSQTSSGWDIATSVSVSAEIGISIGDKELGVAESAKDTLSLGYERDASQSKLNALTSTVEYKGTNSSRNDDYLEYNDAIFNVWRYRIYGSGPRAASDPYKFYETVVPGAPKTEHAGGISIDWYHPTHENGNILSYPPPLATGVPDDVSATPYLVNGKVPAGLHNGLMWNSDSYCFGSDSGTKEISIAGTTSTTDTVTTSNTMQEDNDLTVSAQTTEYGLKLSGSVDWKFGSKQSWGSAKTSTNSTSNSTVFDFVLGSGAASDAYQITPVLYNSLSGAVKMTYGVNVSTADNVLEGCDGQQTWSDRYSAPDPALALPRRFEYLTDGSDSGTLVQFTPTLDREELKSFFIQSTTPDPVDGGFTNLGAIPDSGSTVRLAVTVYNYSVANAANGVSVRFSTISVDDLDNEADCARPTENGWVCPNSARTPIQDGETGNAVPDIQIDSIPAWNIDVTQPNFTVASTLWTIPKALAGKKYRIYVNVGYAGKGENAESNPPQAECLTAPCLTLCSSNSDAANPCLVPTINKDPLAPGQNNEGFSYVTIGAPPAESFLKADVHTTGESLSAVTAQSVLKQVVLISQGAKIKLRVSAMSNSPEVRQHRMMIRSQRGDQAEAEVIAGKLIQGVRTDGSTTAFHTWRPNKPGVHHLTTEIKEYGTDTNKGNNTDDLLAVVLRRPGDLNGDGIVDGNDLAFLQGFIGKPAPTECGYVCDLDGDGQVTEADADLLTASCARANCDFADGQAAQPIELATVQKFNTEEDEAVCGLSGAGSAELLAQIAEQKLTGFSGKCSHSPAADSGCGCRVGSGTRSGLPASLAVLSMLGLLLKRRRSVPSERTSVQRAS